MRTTDKLIKAFEKFNEDIKSFGEQTGEIFVTLYEDANTTREVAFADWYNKNGKGTPTYSDAIEWARRELIDEACEWIDKYLHLFEIKGNILYPKLAQEFIKSMEE